VNDDASFVNMHWGYGVLCYGAGVQDAKVIPPGFVQSKPAGVWDGLPLMTRKMRCNEVCRLQISCT
jgi:hypothetical protein